MLRSRLIRLLMWLTKSEIRDGVVTDKPSDKPEEVLFVEPFNLESIYRESETLEDFLYIT